MRRKAKAIRRTALIFCALAVSACVPDVYLIDRQTVLETQASGQWPELDSIFYERTLSSGPLPLEKTADQRETRELFRMTHSDYAQDKSDSEKGGVRR